MEPYQRKSDALLAVFLSEMLTVFAFIFLCSHGHGLFFLRENFRASHAFTAELLVKTSTEVSRGKTTP